MDKTIISVSAATFILLVILAAYLWKKKYLHFTDDNTIFIMTLPRETFFIGIGCVIFFGAFAVFCVVDFSLFGFLCFYFIVLFFGVYLCIIGVLWRGVIATDSLTFYTPFLPIKKIELHEITHVKYAENRTGAYGTGRKMLEGYRKQKKLFYVDESYSGFDILHYFLEENGKIERTPLVENFSVTATKGDMIRSVISFLFFFVLWVIMLWIRDELGLIYYIFFTLTMLFTLTHMIATLVEKVTLDYNTLSVRTSFGIVKTYEIRQITGIIEEKDYIILCTGNQTIVRLSKDLKNFDYLLARFSNIPRISSSDDGKTSDEDTPK